MKTVSFLGGLVGALLWSLVLALASVVVLEPVSGPRLLPALTGLLELFGPAAAAAALLSLVDDSARGTSAARSVVVVAILMGVIGFALHEGMQPGLQALEQRIRDGQTAESSADNESLEEDEGETEEDPADDSSVSITPIDGPSLVELVLLAESASAEENYYSAWYYYDLALRSEEDQDRQDLAQRRSEMLRMMEERSRPEDDALREEMDTKRQARRAQENGDVVTAWRLLQSIRQTDPADPDVAAILPEVEDELRGQAFYLEDAESLDEQPREGPLVFLQTASIPLLDSDSNIDGMQEWVVYIGDIGPNEARTALFARDVLITSRENPEITISAELARVAEEALLFQGLSRAEPGQPEDALQLSAQTSGLESQAGPPLFPLQVDLQRMPVLTGTEFYGGRLSLPELLRLPLSQGSAADAPLVAAGVPVRAVRNNAALRLLMPLQIVLLVLIGAAIGAGGVRAVPLSRFMQALPAVAVLSVLDQALTLGLQASARLFPASESLLGVTLGLGASMLLPLFLALALMVARVSDITALARR